MNPEILETDGMSLAELRQKAEEEAAKDQPRDDKGKFVAAAPVETVDPVEDDAEPEEFIASRDIDLGDGSGVQVFEGKGDSEASAKDDLLEKITEAQRNATRKIRQQEAELKELRTRAAEKPKAKELTADEEYVLSQTIGKEPSKALRAWFKENTGMEVEELQEVKRGIDRGKQIQAQGQAMEAFLATHSDFDDRNTIDGKTNTNGELMKMKLAELGLPVTSENLHKAYLPLKQSGLLKLKGEEANADTEPKTTATARIEQPRTEVVQTRTRRASGLSTHGRPTPINAELSEDDMRKLPLDELKRRANAQLASR